MVVVRHLSPYARLMTAVLPFLVALMLRFILGKNRVTRGLISLSTAWFLVNVLLAPYSEGMRRDLQELRDKLR
jgi:hypothetical protein